MNTFRLQKSHSISDVGWSGWNGRHGEQQLHLSWKFRLVPSAKKRTNWRSDHVATAQTRRRRQAASIDSIHWGLRYPKRWVGFMYLGLYVIYKEKKERHRLGMEIYRLIQLFLCCIKPWRREGESRLVVTYILNINTDGNEWLMPHSGRKGREPWNPLYRRWNGFQCRSGYLTLDHADI
jgi:hypothetical protein